MLTVKTSAPDRRGPLSRFGLGLIGVLPVALCAIAAPQPASADVGTFETLYTFKGVPDGCELAHSAPGGGQLILDASGNLYGVTPAGGLFDRGTAFSVPPPTSIPFLPEDVVLHSFEGANFDQNADDGIYPNHGLISDSAGTLYGTTQTGGIYNKGTVFKRAPDGTLTILHDFNGGSDGSLPFGGLAFDRVGNLVGTTLTGDGTSRYGTVFRLTKSGAYTLLHTFTGGTDGSKPFSDLVVDRLGNLYGTAANGGDGHGDYGHGTVFEITASGRFLSLHVFHDQGDGDAPLGGLVFDHAGNLYGTTLRGGEANAVNGVGGTVFKLTPNGTPQSPFTTLHTFENRSDGSAPNSDLIFDSAGNLYGKSSISGDLGPIGGIVFRLSPDRTGKLTSFTTIASTDSDIHGGLTLDSFGTLYGMTGNRNDNEEPGSGGAGSGGCGTVFGIFGAAAVGPELIPDVTSLRFSNLTIFGVTLGNTQSVLIRVKGGDYIPRIPLLTGPNASEFAIIYNSCTVVVRNSCVMTLQYTRDPNDPPDQNRYAALNLTGNAMLAIPLFGSKPVP